MTAIPNVALASFMLLTLVACKASRPDAPTSDTTAAVETVEQRQVVQRRVISREDLVGKWEGRLVFDTPTYYAMRGYLWFNIATDPVESQSTFEWRVGSGENHQGFVGEIDSISISADSARLYCRVLRRNFVYHTREDSVGYPANFRMVFTGTLCRADPADIGLMIGSFQATGTDDPYLEFLDGLRLRRFFAWGLPPWMLTVDDTTSESTRRSERSAEKPYLGLTGLTPLPFSVADQVGVWGGTLESAGSGEAKQNLEHFVQVKIFDPVVAERADFGFYSDPPGDGVTNYQTVTDSIAITADTMRLYLYVTARGTAGGAVDIEEENQGRSGYTADIQRSGGVDRKILPRSADRYQDSGRHDSGNGGQSDRDGVRRSAAQPVCVAPLWERTLDSLYGEGAGVAGIVETYCRREETHAMRLYGWGFVLRPWTLDCSTLDFVGEETHAMRLYGCGCVLQPSTRDRSTLDFLVITQCNRYVHNEIPLGFFPGFHAQHRHGCRPFQLSGVSMEKLSEVLDDVTIRFAGDSGDGMQLTGGQFTQTSAIVGNDLATLPDFPAEIRAPAGTTYGVSAFQLHFSSKDVHTPGDAPDVLVAMNPAALITQLGQLKRGGLLIVNQDAFDARNLELAGYKSNPLEDGSLIGYRVHALGITKNTLRAVEGLGLSTKEAGRCKNFYTLGLLYWLYNRPLDPTLKWIEEKFSKKPEFAAANRNAMMAGYNIGDTIELFTSRYEIAPAQLPPGRYRNITGNQALALGMIAACRQTRLRGFLGSYPITPASDILHEVSRFKNFGFVTFQAEDEIAAICSALGASYGGALAWTTTSGPGVALKTEAIGLAVMTELPVIICNVQRGGPSTGLPTKTEQADLLQAMYGRNGECPVPVLAASTPGDCFYMAIEAARIATRYMTPVFLLTDGYLANGAEPWRIPAVDSLPDLTVTHATDPATYHPYDRNQYNARPWAVPGTPGLEHRIGGLEKENITGNINYSPENHESMVKLRAEKIAGIANDIPPLEVVGDEQGGELLILGWGSTYGAIHTAVQRQREKGVSVSHAHLRHLNPLPANTAEVLRRFRHVAIAEMNMGQLSRIIRAEFLVDAKGWNKVQGLPFTAAELEQRILATLAEAAPAIPIGNGVANGAAA